MEREDFEALYLEQEKPLYNTVYRWVWREDEAMDIVQEAFVKLWSARERVLQDGAKPFVYRIALNLASNRLRAHKLWKMTGLEGLLSAFGGAEEQMVTDQRDNQVRKAVEALPEKIRKVVVLARFSGMSYREISQLLEIPEGTVGSRYNKGIRLLESKLSDWRIDDGYQRHSG